MANIIKGNKDGVNGENETYSIPGRSSAISRRALVKEVKQGKHAGFSIYERNGKEYVRANPDSKRKNNVNE